LVYFANAEGRGAPQSCAICDGHTLMLAQVFAQDSTMKASDVAILIASCREQAPTDYVTTNTT